MYFLSACILDTMSTVHQPVPDLSSIAVDPSSYSSHYTYHSRPLHDILYNEPMIPSYHNVESSFTQRPHPHYAPKHYPSPRYFRSQHPNPYHALALSTITPTFNPQFSHDPYRYSYSLPQRPRLDTPSHSSLYHSNVPSYQTTPANTLTHSSQFSHDPSHDGPPLPQRPRLETSSINQFSTVTAHHSSSHVTTSRSTPFSPAHVGPSSSGTISSRPAPSHPSPYSSCASPQHSPSHGLPPPKHPRLVTAPSSLVTTLHGPTSTVVLHTAGPHRDPGYKSTSTAASPLVAPPPPPATTASPCMQRYVTYLKDRYIAKRTPVYDKESSLLYFKAKLFINIALVHKNVKTMTENDKEEMIMDRLHGHVDAIQRKKTILDFSNVCKCDNGSLARCVLVEGAPGVGKTTFVFELCKQWARREILQEWGVVVIIKLRDQRTRTAQTINDLLYHPDPEIRNLVVKELVEQNGKGLLMILDGYDELTTEQKESDSVIQLLMSRKLLCCATLMVTSRPLVTRTLDSDFKQSIDQHIEVLGFTDKNIEEYINSACGDNPELVEDFKEYLSCHPFSSSLMFNPLQCAIVTDLYCSHWQCGDKGFAPKTLTELYTGLVHTLLLRYLTHHPVHKENDWTINSMNDLPDDVKQQLEAVTALAAKGIEKQQYVFDKKDGKVPSETLGLMQREEELTAGIGRSLSHNFLHLTLQEYLAAVHYSQQCDNDEQQLSHILGRKGLFPLNNFLKYYGKKREKSSSSSATHWPAVLFLAGRTQLSGIDLKAGLHNSRDASSDSSVDVSLLHLLYETQCPQLIQSTLVTSRKYISVSGRSALDWFVVGYCIANSTSTWRVEKIATVNPEYFNHLVMGLKLAPQDGSGEGKIVSLDLCGMQSEIFMIFSWLLPFTKNMSSIRMSSHRQNHHKLKLAEPMVEDVFDSYPLLEELTIEGAYNKYFEIKFPCIPQQSNLHTLSLHYCNLSIEATSSLIHFLQSPNGRLLHKLSFSDCKFITTDHTYKFSSFELLETNGKYSLKAEGSSFAVNHWLLYIPSYANLITELVLNVTGQDSSPDETLEGISLNNLHTLSLTKCQLSIKTTSSFIHSLQSKHCKLNKLTLQNCIILSTDSTIPSIDDFSFSEVQHGKFSLTATGSCSTINHWLSLLSSYSVQLTELILSITKQEADETLEGIPLFFELRQNNLHTLSLTTYELNSEETSLLIHSLLSPDYKLNKLSLCKCTISTTDHTYMYQFSSFTLQHTNGKVCLNATGSCSEINHWLLQLSKIKLTESILKIVKQDSSSIETLENISLYRDVLEILRIKSWKSFVVPQFIGQQQNNLHTLSLKECNLSSESTSSLIHSLQSPHCRLHKLALYRCTIPTTDHTLLTTAIVSSTTITHLFFIDKHIDTPSLTALVSGLKQNRRMEELAINNGWYSTNFTKEQLQLLIEGVESSAVKILHLYCSSQYKKLLSDCPLSRDDVVVEWYDHANDVYMKW